MGRQQREQAQLGGGQRRCSGDAGTAIIGELGPESLGLPGEGPEAGPALKQVIDLPHERPGTSRVGQREVDMGQLDPGLHGEVGKRVGQQRPQVLGTEQFPARRRDICPVHGCAGSQRADEGCREALLDPGPAQDDTCLVGKDPGPVPLAATGGRQAGATVAGQLSRTRPLMVR